MTNESIIVNWDNIPSIISHEILRAQSYIERENYYLGIIQIKDAYEVTLKTLALCAIAIYDRGVMNLELIHSDFWLDYYRKNKKKLGKNRKYFKEPDSHLVHYSESTGIENNPLDDIDGDKIIEYLKYRDVLTLILSKQMTLGEWVGVLRRVSNFNDIPKPLENLIKKFHKLIQNDSHSDNSFNLVGWRNSEVGHGALKLELADEDIFNIKKIINLLIDFIHINSSDFYSVDFHLTPKETDAETIYLNGADAITRINREESEISLTIKSQDNKTTVSVDPIISVTSGGIYLFDSFHPWKLQSYSIDYPNGRKNSCHKKLQTWLDERRVRIGYTRDKIYQTLNDARVSDEIRNLILNMTNVINYEEPAYLKEPLEEYIYDKDKGVILLEMDRGMGKTIFTKALNQKEKIKNIFDIYEDDIFIRTIHLNSYILNNQSLFYQRLTEVLNDNQHTRNFHIKTSKSDENDPDGYRKNVAEYLNTFKREIQPDNKVMLVLDGLDEVPGSIEDSIPDCIPVPDMLDDDIYILLTSRTPESSDNPIFNKIEELKVICQLDVFRYTLESNEYQIFVESYLSKSKLPGELISSLLKDSKNLRMVFLTLYTLCNKYSQEDIYLDRSLLVEEYIKILCGITVGTNQNSSARYKKLVDEIMVILTLCKEPISLVEIKYLMEQYTNDFELIGIIYDLNPLIKISRSSGRNNTYSLSHQIIHDQAEKLYSAQLQKASCALWQRVEFLSIDNLNTLLKSADVNVQKNPIHNVVNAVSGVILLFSKSDELKDLQFLSANNKTMIKLDLLAQFIGGMKDHLKKFGFLRHRREQIYKIITCYINNPENKINNRISYYKILYNYSLYLRDTHIDKNLQKSLFFFNILIDELNNEDKNEATLYYEALNSFGIALRRNRKNDEAVRCFKKARLYFKNLTDRTPGENLSYAQIIANEAIDLRNNFYSSFDITLIDKAIELSDKSISIKESIQEFSEKNGNGDSLAFTYHSRGIAEYLKGIYQLLIGNENCRSAPLYKSIYLLKRECNKKHLSDKTILIMEKSVEDFKKSIEVFKSVQAKGYRIAELNMAHCLVHYGDALWFLELEKDAEKLYMNGLEIYDTYIKDGNELSLRMKLYTLVNLIELNKEDEVKRASNINDLEEQIRDLSKIHTGFGLKKEYTEYIHLLFKNKPELICAIK